MFKHFRALVIACLVLRATTEVYGSAISDRGGFFSTEAVKSTNQTVAELERRYGHPIHIETYETVPEGKAESVSQMSRSEKDAFFASWIRQRAKETKASGLFLLICREPAHVHAGAGESLVRRGFTPQARERIVTAMLSEFRQKKFDEGLSAALRQIGEEFDQLKPSSAPLPRKRDGDFTGLIILGGIIVGGLILLSMLGRAFGGAAGVPGMGGGFGSGLLGGLLGALAGNWLYDSFAGHHHQALGADQPHSDPTNGEEGYNDFGSGADFGGGDFGGGDFGGGADFGGGGDF